MSVTTVVLAVLTADSTVAGIVGARVSPLTKEQDITLPAVTFQRISVVPQNALGGFANLDDNAIQVDSWAETYLAARALADACRNAMQIAGHIMTSEFDGISVDLKPFQYQITQQFQVWT